MVKPAKIQLTIVPSGKAPLQYTVNEYKVVSDGEFTALIFPRQVKEASISSPFQRIRLKDVGTITCIQDTSGVSPKVLVTFHVGTAKDVAQPGQQFKLLAPNLKKRGGH